MLNCKYITQKGCLYVLVDKSIIIDFLKYVPEQAAQLQQKRDDGLYHITVLLPTELDSISKTDITSWTNINPDVQIFGFGNNGGTYYLVCGCKEADNLRTKYNLSNKFYHITVGFDFADNHNINKDINSITVDDLQIVENVVKSISNNNKKNLMMFEQLYLKYPDDDLVLYYYSYYLASNNKYDIALNYSTQLMDKKNENYIMGCYVYLTIKKYHGLYVETLLATIIENMLLIKKLNYFDDLDKLLLLVNKKLIDTHKTEKKLNIISYNYDKNIIEYVPMPRNFSFVDGKLAGSGILKEKHITALKLMGFENVINLMEVSYDDKVIKSFNNANIKVHHFPIDDRQATVFETVNNILDIVSKSKRNIIHCLGGVGRTNMLLSCYCIKYLNYSPLEASTILSTKRKVLMTTPQIMFIKKYYGLVNSEFTDSSAKKANLPTLIMLIGAPCSGKTTLSLEFVKKYPTQIIHINQDELGKKTCEEVFLAKSKGSNTIILDRCNATKKERSDWIKSANDKNIVAIYFDIGLEECIKRVSKRKNHPTLSGEGGSKIIQDVYKKLEKPDKTEGFKNIYEVKSDEDLTLIKKTFNLSNNTNKNTITNDNDDNHSNDNDDIKEDESTNKNIIEYDHIIKFPRTKHIINLGAMTRDDLLYTSSEQKDFLNMELLIEEKIDGANLGIFLDKSTMKLMVQNRSHFVNSAYHEQFKLLDKWITSHSAELFEILQDNEYILYGEWIFFKHSIHYTNIPDYFMLFDIYDRITKQFLSREIVSNIIKETTLQQVPVIARGKFTIDELKKLAVGKSIFYDGPVEGIYVRAVKDGITKYRGKIVRSNFIAGDDHWTKNKYTMNVLKN